MKRQLPTAAAELFAWFAGKLAPTSRYQGWSALDAAAVLPELPAEVWSLIIGQCHAPERNAPLCDDNNVFVWACLCTRFYYLTGQYVRTHMAELRGTDNRVLMYHRHLDTLALRSTDQHQISRHALAQMTQLTSLSLDVGCTVIDNHTLLQLPLLRVLRLSGQRYVDDSGIETHWALHTLALPGNLNVTSRAFRNLRQLTCVDLSYSRDDADDDDGRVHFGFGITDKALAGRWLLTELNLKQNTRITDTGIAHLVNLRALNLDGNDMIHGDHFDRMTRLACLSLCGNDTVREDNLAVLAPRLQCLWLWDASGDIGSETLLAMTALRHLALGQFRAFTGELPTRDVLPRLTNLRSLLLDGGTDVTSDTLSQLTALQHLTVLDDVIGLLSDRVLEAMTALQQLTYWWYDTDIAKYVTMEKWVDHSRLRLVPREVPTYALTHAIEEEWLVQSSSSV